MPLSQLTWRSPSQTLKRATEAEKEGAAAEPHWGQLLGLWSPPRAGRQRSTPRDLVLSDTSCTSVRTAQRLAGPAFCLSDCWYLVCPFNHFLG